MADDIRLVIGVEQSGLLKAITSTETLEKKVKKLSDAYARDAVSYGRYNKAIGDLAASTKKSKKELLDYGKALRADEQATKQATLATKQFAQARKDAIAEDQRRTAEAKKATQVAAQQSAEEERLKNKFVQGYTAASLYSKELNDLGIARKRGIISIEQQRVALDRLNKEYAEGSGRFAMYANAMGKSANRAGVAMQQTGYQVGDFLVQVQSGTNPMVAFGQQATQLVGVMYLLPQATLAAKVGLMGLQVSMGALIAAVSIIIPLATAFGAYWMRSKENADEAASAVDRLKSAIDGLESVTFDNKSKGLGAFEEKWKSILSLQREYLTEQIKMSRADLFGEMGLGKGLNDLDRALTTIQANMAAGKSGPGDTEAYEADVALLAKMKAIKKEINGLDLTNSKTLASSYETALGRLSAAHDLTTEEKEQLRLFADKAGIIQTISQEGKKLADSQKSANTDLQGQLDKLGKRANVWSRSMSKGYKQAQDATAVFKEQQRLQDQALYLQALELKYTKDSDQYRQAENRFERENLALKLEQAGVDDTHIQSLLLGNIALEEGLRLLRAQRDVTLTMFEGSDAAQRMRKYAGRGTPTGKGQPSGTTTGTDREDTRQTGREAVEQLIIQAKHKQKLVSLTDEQARYEGLLFKMQEDNAKKRNPLNEQQLQQEARKIHLINEQTVALEKQKKAQEDLADTIGSSMEDAMMSMVDGTKSVKDAFRDMARDIVRHLYKVLVVQRAINAIGGIMSGSSNPVMQTIGGGLESYGSADGGGYTGNGPRSGGLDGKGGFMAMMHPRETVIDHTKANSGGTGQNVVINQSFNFQANGDDSVKKIIAQAAPQIAQMTKKSMLDDRRRGGTTKAVFG
jgi:hypothetical protein